MVIFFLVLVIIFVLSYNGIEESDVLKKDMNKIGVLILIGIFAIFYVITTQLLDRRNLSREIPKNEEPVVNNTDNYDNEKKIVENLYDDIRILYDVVNNKFTVSQEDTINIGNIIYKRITNFDEIMNPLFTENGIKKYISDLNSYFAYTENGYYLAGNLVNYQTYYFRGDQSNIYIINSSDSEINAIIYEKWTSGNKNTLATIKVVMEEGNWLVDDIEILSAE